MSATTFRSYEAADVHQLPALFVRAIQTVYPNLVDGPWLNGLHDVEATYITPGGDFVVGVEGTAIIAMGGIKHVNESIGEIVRVAVEPTRQGGGLGQLLLKAIEANAKRRGFNKLILDTTAAQVGAIRLYDKNGYVQTDRRFMSHSTGNTFDTYFFEKFLT